jgi:hypothetical protein
MNKSNVVRIRHGRIKCLTDGREFNSAIEAAKFYKINPSSIYKCITQVMISTHGLQFASETGAPPRLRNPKHKKVLIHELQGMRFEKLTVVSRAGTTNSGKTKWKCRCDCGKETISQTRHLLEGRRISCGCLKLDKSRFRQPTQSQVLKNILRNYKNGAKARNYEFSLSNDEFSSLIFGACHYCGNPGHGNQSISYSCNNQKTKVSVAHNGIDRMDNNLGYIKDNCVTCCEICNRSKMRMGFIEFIEYLDRIVTYRINLPKK